MYLSLYGRSSTRIHVYIHTEYVFLFFPPPLLLLLLSHVLLHTASEAVRLDAAVAFVVVVVVVAAAVAVDRIKLGCWRARERGNFSRLDTPVNKTAPTSAPRYRLLKRKRRKLKSEMNEELVLLAPIQRRLQSRTTTAKLLRQTKSAACTTSTPSAGSLRVATPGPRSRSTYVRTYVRANQPWNERGWFFLTSSLSVTFQTRHLRR